MFLVYAVYEVLSQEPANFGRTFENVFWAIGVMTCLPILVFYLGFKYLDARNLLHQRRPVRARAADKFGPALAFTHSCR
jgi:hypothetical protein